MKKLTHLMTLCMVALLAYNCATDNTQDLLEEINGEISVEAYFEDLDSRTSLTDDGDGGSIVWDADDSITAIAADGTTTECKIVAMYDGHVVFRVPANTIYAVYPHLNSTSYTPSTGIITYALSSTKSLNGDDKVFVKGENPMVAKMSNNSLRTGDSALVISTWYSPISASPSFAALLRVIPVTLAEPVNCNWI